MQKLLLCLFCILGTTCSVRAEDGSGALSVAGVLDDVISRLPRCPVFISGRLETRQDGSRRFFFVEARVNFAGSIANGMYVIGDSFGVTLEKLYVSRSGNGALERTYYTGTPLAQTPPPPLSASIQDTPVKWSDLTLAFLWWREGEITGTESLKGRSCTVLTVSAPENEPTEMRRVKLWIDRKYMFLMRAEEFAGDGTAVRRLSVKSFKKIGEEYMIKDIEVEDLQKKNSARLRIDELCDLDSRQKR